MSLPVPRRIVRPSTRSCAFAIPSDGGDPERLVERRDPRDAEPRDLAQLDYARRQRGVEPIELLALARQVELTDRPGQRRTDTGELGQPAVGHERRLIRSQRLERPGAALVRAGLEGIPASKLTCRPAPRPAREPDRPGRPV
jgi:hypothetical protein